MELIKKEPLIIIATGKARSGKNTAVSFLKEKYEQKNKKVVVLSFVAPLKEYIIKSGLWNGLDETKPRELLIYFGTDIIRKKIDEMFYIKRMIQDIEVYSYLVDVILIDDARLKIEVNSIKENFNKVKVIRINRENINEINHITENDLDNYKFYDSVLENNSSLKELEKKVDFLVNEVDV